MCCAEGASLIVLKWGSFPLCAAPKAESDCSEVGRLSAMCCAEGATARSQAGNLPLSDVVSRFDTSQYILRAQGNDCCNDQPKEHQDQHEWIEKNVAPGVQKVDVPTQIRWYLFCRRHVGGRG